MVTESLVCVAMEEDGEVRKRREGGARGKTGSGD